MNPPDASAYVVRADALSPVKTYRLTPDGLAITEADAAPRVIRWSDIAAVDLAYAATRYADNRHVCRLQLQSGAREELPSCHYEGFAQFRDQAKTFNAFIRALHAALATHAAGVRFGREERAWRPHARRAVAAGLILALLGLAITAGLQGFERGWVMVKLLVLVAMLPALLRWVRRSRGGRYDPLAIPAKRLPAEPELSAPRDARRNPAPSRGWRLVVVGLLLWLIWVEWRPQVRAWPTDLAEPRTGEELGALPTGREFLLPVRLEPLPATPPREWQGRFVFRHRQRQDLSDSGGKTVRLVTVAEHRPALRLVWSGGTWEIPAESYGLDFAPRIEPRFWPRKSLGLSPVDVWDRSSTGFRVAEAALALGRIAADGAPEIIELLPGDREQAITRWQAVERPRFILILAVQLALTLGLLAWLKNPSPENTSN